MITQKEKDESLFTEDFFTQDNFLLMHTTARQAFTNLSRSREAFTREELLDEIKQLVREQIREQVREQVSS